MKIHERVPRKRGGGTPNVIPRVSAADSRISQRVPGISAGPFPGGTFQEVIIRTFGDTYNKVLGGGFRRGSSGVKHNRFYLNSLAIIGDAYIRLPGRSCYALSRKGKGGIAGSGMFIEEPIRSGSRDFV